ncbi:MAG: hypothetical protein DCC71_07655 [Proteobacteria bacterium]|nr:MAG: hypothetical protein DCC71_07655 [Pseudomonadota bacterium]
MSDAWRPAPVSEKRVFDCLRDGLPKDPWLVLHSRRFVLPGGRGAPAEEGEIDFVVLDVVAGEGTSGERQLYVGGSRARSRIMVIEVRR